MEPQTFVEALPGEILSVAVHCEWWILAFVRGCIALHRLYGFLSNRCPGAPSQAGHLTSVPACNRSGLQGGKRKLHGAPLALLECAELRSHHQDRAAIKQCAGDRSN